MSFALRLILIAASCLTTGYILRKISKSSMKIEYSVFWIILSGCFLVFSIFPGVPTVLSKWMGFQAPVNFIFLFIIFALILKSFLNSIEISKMETRIEELTRKIAVQEALDLEAEAKPLAAKRQNSEIEDKVVDRKIQDTKEDNKA